MKHNMKFAYFIILLLTANLFAGCKEDDEFTGLKDSIAADPLVFPGRIWTADAGLAYVVPKNAGEFEIQLEVPNGQIASIEEVYARVGRVTVYGPVGSATQVVGSSCSFPTTPTFKNIPANNSSTFTFKVSRAAIDALKCSTLTPTSPFFYDFKFAIKLADGKVYQSNLNYYARVYPSL
jgi:hypothetical protein